jgi:SOS response regulatory protein OraA/RecX
MANPARISALRMLAVRRLTEAQLWKKLEACDFTGDDITEAIASCKRDGYVDDGLFATLYVEGARKAVGDARLVADLVKRGIDREAAQRAVSNAPSGQSVRIRAAYAKLVRTKGDFSYQSAARALERLGFPTSLIYRILREEAASAFGDLDGSAVSAAEGAP